uniref:CCHC-type domain-containing protein n=1 Tax=Tanacetum cinerariifolium TaxID=118510 RepID=A0A6L2M524_TANCI|nr:hypothetical protein [Tanacetum cinerariifolium]
MVRTSRQNPTPESSPERNPDIATIIAQQLQNIIPQIVPQVTANVNNANEGNENGGNSRCSYKTFTACNPKEFDGKGGAVALTRWIEKMESVFDNSGCTANQRVRFHELTKLVIHLVTPKSLHIKRYISRLAPQICRMLRATQPTTIQSAILTAGILPDKAVCCRTLTKGNDKRKGMEESSKQGSTWKNNKKSKTGSGYVATFPPMNDNVSSYPKCAKCYTFYLENTPCKLCYNCQKPGHYARQCCALIRQVVPVNAVRMGHNQRTCYECRSLDHLRYDCPKWKQATGQFAPLLNVEPCIVNPSYVIEIADGESVEVDRVIRYCKLELGNSLFTIDLTPLGHKSFDVIVRMDWLSKNKAVIVCHEKLVEIPIKDGGILRVQRERILGAAEALMKVKIDEPMISDIPVVRDFTDVFLEDLLGLPPQR